MTASGQLSRPPAGTFVTAYGQSLVSVVSRTQRNLFGQLDGTVNPAPAESDFEALLFSDLTSTSFSVTLS